jgi:hypothetical protein
MMIDKRPQSPVTLTRDGVAITFAPMAASEIQSSPNIALRQIPLGLIHD